MDADLVCIYCLEKKDKNKFRGREHVMPRCFGSFQKNLVLHDLVCDDCNQCFGNEIDRCLARDTLEGIERYKYGIKPEKQPSHKRLKFKITEGELLGMSVMPIPSRDGNGIDNKPIPQIFIINPISNCTEYYALENIPAIDDFKKRGFDTKNLKINLIFSTDSEKESLKNKLREKGYKILNGELVVKLPKPAETNNKTWVEGIVTVDKIIFRGLCKIAFNYLIFTQGRHFALSENFSKIRVFIKYGNGNSKEFVFPMRQRILEHERASEVLEAHGHSIILEWHNNSIQARLRLFNLNTYLIRLCDDYKGVYIPINSGHWFDVKSKKVSPL